MDAERVFTNRYGYERGCVSKYKERRRYGRLSEAGMFVGFVALVAAIAASRLTPSLDGVRGTAAVGAALVVLVGATAFWLLSYYLVWESGLTDERVAYHELAAAMNAYERENLGAVVAHLVEMRTYLVEANAHRLSDALKGHAVSYVDAVTGSKNPELALGETFEEFAAVVVDGVVGHERRDVEALVEDAARGPVRETDSLHRAMTDAHDVFASGMFGFWGGVVVTFSLGLFAAEAVGNLFGGILIGVVLTAYGVYLRNLA